MALSSYVFLATLLVSWVLCYLAWKLPKPINYGAIGAIIAAAFWLVTIFCWPAT